MTCPGYFPPKERSILFETAGQLRKDQFWSRPVAADGADEELQRQLHSHDLFYSGLCRLSSYCFQERFLFGTHAWLRLEDFAGLDFRVNKLG